MTGGAWSLRGGSAAALLVLPGLSAAAILLAYLATPGAVALVTVGSGLLAAVMWRPKIGVMAAMLCVPLVIWDVEIGSLGGLSPTEILMVLTALAAVAHFAMGGTVHRLQPGHGAFAGLLIVVTAGMVVAEDPAATAKIVFMWGAFLVVSALVASLDRRDLERVLRCVVLAGGVLGLMVVVSQTDQELVAGGELAVNRATASFEHPNLLAFFLVMAIPPGLALAATSRGALRGLVVVSAGLAVAALLLTLSREGIIGASVAFTVMLAWPAFRRLGFALLGLVAVVVALNATPLSQAREVSVVGRELNIVAQRLGTLTQPEVVRSNPRLSIYRRAPAMLADYPVLGVGAGNFPLVSPRYGMTDIGRVAYDHPHNVFLTIAIEIGLVGLVLFVGFVLAIGRAALSVTRDRVGELDPLALSLAAALGGLLVVSLTDYPLRANFVMATFMVEVGALFALHRLSEIEAGPAATGSSR